MRVLVTGGSGVIGRQLVPLLTGLGHDVTTLTRPGARPVPDGIETVLADALDRDALKTAVHVAEPDVVVHLLTAIPARVDPKRLARDMAATNRLRTEGTANLIAAAGDARLVAQSLAYAYRPTGGQLADEDQPLWADGPRQLRPVVEALAEHERLTRNAGGVVLRVGHLYGPGSAYAAEGSFVEDVRARRVPIVGRGASVFSFTQARDAASAVVASLDPPVTGTFNVVDDDPAPLHEWLPQMARIVGAPAPRHTPAALARLAVGGWGVAFMTKLPGVDNRRARDQLGWQPGIPSWRDGFLAELAGIQADDPHTAAD